MSELLRTCLRSLASGSMRYWEAISGGVEVVVLTPEPLFRGWRRFVQEVSFRFSQTLDQVRRRRRRGWGYYFHFFMDPPPPFFSSPVYIGLIGCSTRWEEEEGVRLLFPFFMYFPLFSFFPLCVLGWLNWKLRSLVFKFRPFSAVPLSWYRWPTQLGKAQLGLIEWYVSGKTEPVSVD